MTDEPKRRPGRPAGERRTARVDLQLNPDLRKRVRMAAAGADMAMGEWMRIAAEEKLERDSSST
jgi:hypothetical protein